MPLTLLLIGLGFIAWVWLRGMPANQRAPAIMRLTLVVGIFIVVLLAATGRVHFVFALLAFLYPLLRKVFPSWLASLASDDDDQPKTGRQSHVSSEILEMSLDHDSGTMNGKILKGPLEGKQLAELSESEFLDLLRYCRTHDEDSARLLETYLDRRFGDSWRADDNDGTDAGGDANRQADTGKSPLTESEALDILGLQPGASREEIIQAHRRMMQKLHPDHGGSNYLAARVNEAKEYLLG